MFFNSVSPVKLTTETPLVTRVCKGTEQQKLNKLNVLQNEQKDPMLLNARCLKFILKERRKSEFGSFIATISLLCSPSVFLPSYYLSKRPLSLWVYRRNNPRGQLVEQTYRPRDDSTVFIDYY